MVSSIFGEWQPVDPAWAPSFKLFAFAAATTRPISLQRFLLSACARAKPPILPRGGTFNAESNIRFFAAGLL